MNRISVTEQPLLKTKDIQIGVGEQASHILADKAFIFLQQHNLERAFSGMDPTYHHNINLLTNSKKNCKCFYESLLKDNACYVYSSNLCFIFKKWKDNF